MSLVRKHSRYAVVFNTTVLGGITQQRVFRGNEVRAEATSGEIYARHIAFVRRRPGATFTSLNVAALLGQVPLLGTNIATLGAAVGIKLFAQKHVDAGTRAAGANHRQWQIRKGIAVLRSLQCEWTGDARLDAEALAAYDGTNDPVEESDAVTLPAGIGDAERFTLGPVTIGGVALTQVKSLQIDFGVTVSLDGADSDVFPVFASILRIEPTVTLRGIDLEWLKAANIPRTGASAAHADTTIYLRKRAQTGATFVDDATAEHIKITGAGLLHVETAMDDGGGEGAEATAMLKTHFDGTNAPLVITAASAIA